jgi:hypothetical protein
MAVASLFVFDLGCEIRQGSLFIQVTCQREQAVHGLTAGPDLPARPRGRYQLRVFRTIKSFEENYHG